VYCAPLECAFSGPPLRPLLGAAPQYSVASDDQKRVEQVGAWPQRRARCRWRMRIGLAGPLTHTLALRAHLRITTKPIPSCPLHPLLQATRRLTPVPVIKARVTSSATCKTRATGRHHARSMRAVTTRRAILAALSRANPSTIRECTPGPRLVGGGCQDNKCLVGSVPCLSNTNRSGRQLC